MAQGSARGTERIKSWLVAAMVAAGVVTALPAAAQGAGPTAIGVDESGTSYVGWASGAVARYDVGGTGLGQWATPVADADGRPGPIMAIDVGDAAGLVRTGNVWVLDGNRRVQEFTRAGTFIRGFRLDDCDGSNTPDPGLEGGIDVTPEMIYVAHPCANRILRYRIDDLPASGTASVTARATAEAGHTFAPHGIAAQTGGGASPPQTATLYVAHARSSVVRQYDLVSLNLLGDAPGGHLGGRYDDVFIDPAGNLFTTEINDAAGNDDRIYRYDEAGAENLNFGGTGSALGQLSDARAFDVLPQSGAIFVADTGNERIQQFTETGSPVWAAAAPDPGPYVPPPTQDPPGTPAPDPGTGGGGQLPAGGGGGSAGAPGAPGVEIDDDARYTNSQYVSLTIREPAGTTAVEISNSSAFADRDTRGVQSSLDYEWTLDQSGSDLTARTVYVRFPGSGSDRVYSDEILLDRKAPLVGGATLSPKGKRKGKKRRWVLRVIAEDELSGLDQLRIAGSSDGDYESRNFDHDITVKRPNKVRFVRVTDFAGNSTPPIAVTRRGR